MRPLYRCVQLVLGAALLMITAEAVTSSFSHGAAPAFARWLWEAAAVLATTALICAAITGLWIALGLSEFGFLKVFVEG